jgi:hypothetical protein
MYAIIQYCIWVAKLVSEKFVNVSGAQESIPPAYVAWRDGTPYRVVVLAQQAGNRFLGSLKGLQSRAQRLKAWGFTQSEDIKYSTGSIRTVLVAEESVLFCKI